ncbi:MAG: tetratricopeptide repeat protein [Deltaproteobacteria bacterium]|nr:tetratricopeptide repeat protein [Deltaproteobacteria bacterium]
MVTTLAPVAHAQQPAGASALRQARASWERGSFESAEQSYREALEKGGLAPNEVLEGYVRLGSIRASLGKREQAVAAFRAASILDATFAVPSEAGPKGPAYAAQAKKDTAKIGSIQLAVKGPKEVPSGKSFSVTAMLDSAHIPIVTKVALLARDGTSAKEATADARPQEQMELEVPSDVTMPNASILIRVDALDSHGNRLASVEERVRVHDSGGAVAAVVAPPAGGAASGGLASAPSPSGDTSLRKGGSFWSSPWPYVIGGIALAGAGTAVYFGTRPADEVAVGQVGVRTR